jgi:hypothetical protein
VYFDDVANSTVQYSHGARVGTWQFNDRFGGLNVDQRLIECDDVTHADLPDDNLGLDETFTHVGQ